MLVLAVAAILASSGAAHAPIQTATVRVPVANVWEAPNAGHLPLDPHVWPTAAVTYRERLSLVGHMPTQVLYGETVRVLAKRRGWTQIAVPDQPSPLDPRGYPGWVRSWQLGSPVAGKTVFVTARSATLANGTEVGFATQVPVGAVPAAATRALPHTRADLVRTAEQFLGLRYLWGGLSAWGYDCSGLTWCARVISAAHAGFSETHRPRRHACHRRVRDDRAAVPSRSPLGDGLRARCADAPRRLARCDGALQGPLRADMARRRHRQCPAACRGARPLVSQGVDVPRGRAGLRRALCRCRAPHPRSESGGPR